MFVTVPVAIAVLIDQNIPSFSSDGLRAGLLTVAEILGGVSGLLFAAIVFGMQFHGDKLGHSVFAVRYLSRREGVVPIAAMSMGVIGANALGGLVATQWLPGVAVGIAVLDFLLVPLVLIATLWLLNGLVVGVSGDFFEQTLVPGLTWEYERALEVERRHAELLAEYTKATAEIGLPFKISAGLGFSEARDILFCAPRSGYLRDVDLQALRDIYDLIKSYCPHLEGELGLAPGDRLNGQALLVLSSRDTADEQAEVTTETRNRIEAMLKRAIRATKHSAEPDVVRVVTQFIEAVVQHAKDDSPKQLDRALEVLGHLIDHRSRVADSAMPAPTFYRRRLPDCLDGFNYADLAVAAVQSGDIEKTKLVLQFAFRLLRLSIQRADSSMFGRVAHIPMIIYVRGIAIERLCDTVAEATTRSMAHLLDQFESRRAAVRKVNRESEEREAMTLIAALGLLLRLMKEAVEVSRTDDVIELLSVLFEFDRHRLIREGRLGRYRQNDTMSLRACDLHSYCQIALLGWLLHLAQNGKGDASVMSAIIPRLVGDFEDRHEVVRIWESVRSWEGVRIDEALGLEWWELPGHVVKPGVALRWGLRSEWVEAGFVALAMSRPSGEDFDLPEELKQPPAIEYDWRAIERRTINLLGSKSAIEALGLAEDAARTAAGELIDLIKGRICLRKRFELSTVWNTPIAAEIVARLASDASNVLTNEGLVGAITQLGGNKGDATYACPLIRRPMVIARASLQAGAGNTEDWAKALAAELTTAEAVFLSLLTVESIRETLNADDTAKLAEFVRDGVKDLRRRSYEPSLVLAPDLPAIWKALTLRRPDRSVQGAIAEFDGLPIVLWPFGGLGSIVIVDVQSFFGSVGRGAPAVQIVTTDDRAARNTEIVRRAEVEADPEGIPSSFDLSALVVAAMVPRYGIRAPGAAVKITLPPTLFGFAMCPSDLVYHQPGCAVIADRKDVNFSTGRGLESDSDERTPCETCNPDDWFIEGSEPVMR